MKRTFKKSLEIPRCGFRSTLAAVMFFAVACGGGQAPSTPPPPDLAAPTRSSVEEVLEMAIAAHGGMEAWRALGEVSFIADFEMLDTAGAVKGEPSRMKISFPADGRNEIRGEMGGRTMTYRNGATDVRTAEGKAVPEERAHAEAKFALPTFQYIFSLPWKLKDAGARHELLSDREHEGLVGMRVTYEPGTGDTPDDWYKFYFDRETGLMKEVLWIVTAPGHDNLIEWCEFRGYADRHGLKIPGEWVFIPAKEDGTRTGPPMARMRLVAVEPSSATASMTPSTLPATRPAN